MPLTPKGKKILGHMEKEYGAKKGKSVFYASKNKGNISGVDCDDADPELANRALEHSETGETPGSVIDCSGGMTPAKFNARHK
jgi:hypothetical protein